MRTHIEGAAEYLVTMYQIVANEIRAESIELVSESRAAAFGKHLLALAHCLEDAAKCERLRRGETRRACRPDGISPERDLVCENRERTAFQLRIMVEESKAFATREHRHDFIARVRALVDDIDASASDVDRLTSRICAGVPRELVRSFARGGTYVASPQSHGVSFTVDPGRGR